MAFLSEFAFDAGQGPAPVPRPPHGDRQVKQDPSEGMLNQISAHKIFIFALFPNELFAHHKTLRNWGRKGATSLSV
jgi:hypothetical protein